MQNVCGYIEITPSDEDTNRYKKRVGKKVRFVWFFFVFFFFSSKLWWHRLDIEEIRMNKSGVYLKHV